MDILDISMPAAGGTGLSSAPVQFLAMTRDEPADAQNPYWIYQDVMRRLHFPPESGT